MIDAKLFQEWVGFIAATLTTVSFVPQAVLILRTRNAAGISLPMYAMFTTGVALWLAYGLMTVSWPLIVANTVTLVLASLILVTAWRARRAERVPYTARAGRRPG